MNTTRALTLFLALVLLGLVLLALSTPTARANPGVLRVAVDGATSGACGSSWANPCDLQHALRDVAVSGDELWVVSGTYTPTTSTYRYATFQLRDNIALYGGFAGGETLRSQRNFTTHVTILSGDLNGNDNSNIQYWEPTRADNAYHVVTGSGVTTTAVLDGFTVMGGNANSAQTAEPESRGGGMYNDGASPILTNVTFVSNSASYSGGGLYNQSSSPMLTNVNFSNNWTGYGGGMSNWYGSNPTLTNVTFISNNGYWQGGGMDNSFSSPTLTNVTFISNWAGLHANGGGIYNYSSSPMMTNVTFTGNSAVLGGGMFNEANSNPTLTNLTFSANTASSGGGMYNYTSNPTIANATFASNTASASGSGVYNSFSSPTVHNTILWGNTAPYGSQISNSSSSPSLSDSIVQGGCPADSTCHNILTTDPHLGPLGDWGGSTRTIPLLPGSSAINAGNDATCAPTDQRGKPRVGTCDIGAFELQGISLTKTRGDNQLTPAYSPFAIPLAVQLTETGSPLPFPGVTITFTAPSSGASAAWGGSLTQTATTNASGVATVSPPTANGILGFYGVTTHAAVATAPVTFTLTNALGNYLPLIWK